MYLAIAEKILKLNMDAPSPWGIYFQDSATPQMEGLLELHDNIMYYLVIILFSVGWVILAIIRNYINTKSPISHKYLNHGTLIELIWTITPLQQRRWLYLNGERLSNSGDLLKLMVPTLLWKWVGGWTNSSGMVISHKIIERLMEYRGSKSTVYLSQLYNVVKEQRVEGSEHISWTKVICLRCTLMGFERNYQAKNLSKQKLQIRQYSRSLAILLRRSPPCLQSSITNIPRNFSSIPTINPWFITGFVDAEGSFTVSVLKSSNLHIGWQVGARFQLTLHKKDFSLLREIQAFFGGKGKIVLSKNNTCVFRVDSLKDTLKVIIPHFNVYLPLTQKLGDYLFFRDIVIMMNNKEHLTKEGLNKIVSIKASLNHGLSKELKRIFHKVQPVLRPLIIDQKITNPNWMAGFVSGDGSFYLTIRKSHELKVGYRAEIGFQITQHSRDQVFMESFISYFNCGKLKKDTRYSVLYFTVSNFTNLFEKIIPFFKQHKILGVKSLDFKDWCKAAEIIKMKSHLTSKGINELRELQKGMNSKRWLS